MTEQTPTTTEPLKNPYIAVLEELTKKGKKKRPPELIIRGGFALFCANVWEFRTKNILKLNIEETELSPFSDFLRAPLTEKELELFTKDYEKKQRLSDHIQKWLEGLEILSRIKAQAIIDINDDIETLFSCLSDIKADFTREKKVVYIEAEKLKQLAPLLGSFNSRKLGFVVELRACDLVARTICDFYEVPDLAFRTLTPRLAKYLRGLNSNEVLDNCFFCRFPKEIIKDLRMALSTGSFYKLNDYSVVSILSMNAKKDPKFIFDTLKKRKNSSVENLSFDEYLKLYSGENDSFAKENPSIIDYLI